MRFLSSLVASGLAGAGVGVAAGAFPEFDVPAGGGGGVC